MKKVHSALYSYIPFSLLFFFNIFMVVEFNIKMRITVSDVSSAHNQNRRRLSKQRNLNNTTIALTSLFIIMTIPGTLCSIFYDKLIMTDSGTFLLYLGDSINNTYHALNIIILLATNIRFRQETKQILCCQQINSNPNRPRAATIF